MQESDAQATMIGLTRTPDPANSFVTNRSPKEDPKLIQGIQRFLEGQRASSTRVEYAKAIRYFLSDVGVRTFTELLSVGVQDVIHYRNDLQAADISPATIMMRLSSITGLFQELVARGIISRNPADSKVVKRLRVSSVSRTEGLNLVEV